MLKRIKQGLEKEDKFLRDKELTLQRKRRKKPKTRPTIKLRE